MAASIYWSAAAELRRLAADVDDCDSSVLQPVRDRLPDGLRGEVTAFLEAEYAEVMQHLRSGADAIRVAAEWARAEAGRIETTAAMTAGYAPDPTGTVSRS